MKKYTMLIIAGGLFLIVGILLSFNKKEFYFSTRITLEISFTQDAFLRVSIA